ncbi:hypothetical protein GCM10007108_16350 [Thermogymnomonas acidicola]|uniref:2-phosphoglycerate kinase n=1 Tax=Thermogymnomonas acidicola TaxID=399579 RepID=A0AA37FA12_9ARCH|nr:AAA family ATPase [Thermogymnomonas acidicola]GGM78902.1 hypothetical protein GCM10007108_16350 [Thermogymnomonas acidicola]
MNLKAPVVLIGGIPGVGKTSMAGAVARMLDIDIVLSGDYLREMVRPLLTGREAEVMSKSVYEAWSLFGEESEQSILRGYLEQGRILNRGINQVLRRAISNGEPLVVETLHFIPSQLEADVMAGVIPLYLYISDERVNAERLLEREKYTHFSSPGHRLARQLPRYRVMMRYSLEECGRMGIRAFDNLDYWRTRAEVLRYVNEMARSGRLEAH